MLISNRTFSSGFAILAAAVLASGCDRVQSLTKSLKTTREKLAPAPSTAPQATGPMEPVMDLDSSNYASFVARSNQLVIVDFYADWCGPCKMIGPVLEQAVAAHPGVVSLGKVNVDRAGQLASEQQVRGIPDVRFFRNGKQVDQLVGFPGEAAVLEKVNALSQGLVASPAATSPTAATAPATSNEPKMQRMKKDWLPPGVSRR